MYKADKNTCPHKTNILVRWGNSSHERDDRLSKLHFGGCYINGEKLVKETGDVEVLSGTDAF